MFTIDKNLMESGLNMWVSCVYDLNDLQPEIVYTSNLRVHRISIISKSNGAPRIPGPPEIGTPSTSAVLTSKQSMEGVAPKLDTEKIIVQMEKYASFQKNIHGNP